MNETKTFEEWASELRGIFTKKGLTDKQMPDFSYDTWGGYYEDGYSPQGAFDEEMSRGD